MPTITVKSIPPGLYELLKQSAAANRRSINNEIIVHIERGVRGRKIDVEDLLMRARQCARRPKTIRSRTPCCGTPNWQDDHDRCKRLDSRLSPVARRA